MAPIAASLVSEIQVPTSLRLTISALSTTTLFFPPIASPSSQFTTVSSSFAISATSSSSQSAFLEGSQARKPSDGLTSASNISTIVGSILGGIMGIAAVGVAIFYGKKQIENRIVHKSSLIHSKGNSMMG